MDSDTDACARPIPRRLYILWLQGERKAPAIIRHNLRRWRELNTDFDIVALDEKSSRPYLDHLPFNAETLSAQTRSDIIRLRLLAETGGVWADATVYPVMPLSQWLPSRVTASGFFACHRPEPARPIASWFLAAAPNSKIIRKWHDLATHYWSVPREPMSANDWEPENPLEEMRPYDTADPAPYPYFWVHHLFAILLQIDAGFRRAWEACMPIDALPLHDLQFYYKRKNRMLRAVKGRFQLDERVLQIVLGTEIQKLNWRRRYPIRELLRVEKQVSARFAGD